MCLFEYFWFGTRLPGLFYYGSDVPVFLFVSLSHGTMNCYADFGCGISWANMFSEW